MCIKDGVQEFNHMQHSYYQKAINEFIIKFDECCNQINYWIWLLFDSRNVHTYDKVNVRNSILIKKLGILIKKRN